MQLYFCRNSLHQISQIYRNCDGLPSDLHQNLLVFEIDKAPDYDDSTSPVIGVPDLSSPSPLVVEDAALREDHLLSDEQREKLKRDRFRSVLQWRSKRWNIGCVIPCSGSLRVWGRFHATSDPYYWSFVCALSKVHTLRDILGSCISKRFTFVTQGFSFLGGLRNVRLIRLLPRSHVLRHRHLGREGRPLQLDGGEIATWRNR